MRLQKEKPVISLLVVPLAIFGGVFSITPILLLAHALMAKTMELLQLLSGFDWAVWQQATPAAWSVLLAVVGLLWIFMPKGLPMRYLGFIFCLPLVTLKPDSPEFSEFRLSVLDVGQGLSVVIQTHRHVLLYDTGTKMSAQNDSGARIVVPYLRSIGVGHLDGLVVSHDDIDHSGGMESVLSSVPTDWMLSSLKRPVENVKNIHCFAGQSWQWDGVSFEVLSPWQESYQSDSVKDNNRSCVLRVSAAKGSALLAGDIEREVEAALVESASVALKSDVLIVPHHGSKTSSTLGFVEAVNPKVAVFTAGYRNRFGHPKAEIVERYVANGIKTYRSDLDGAVLVDICRAGDLGVIAWRHQARRYWYD